MKKEVGILYKTICDECGSAIESLEMGTQCQVCKRDLCPRCRGTVWYAVFGDNWSEESFMICDNCERNISPELDEIINLINSLHELNTRGYELYNYIEEKIRGVKKNG